MRWLLSAMLGVVCISATARAEQPVPATNAQVDGAPLLILSGPRDLGAPLALALADVVRRDGGAFLDLRPKAPRPPSAAMELSRAVAAYQEFDYGRALSHLSTAIAEAEASGADGLTTSELSDLYIYRAMVKHGQGDTSAAWEDFVRAATIEPSRHLDAVRFSPSIVASFDRARAQVVAGPTTELVVEGEDGCTLRIDGRSCALATRLTLANGTHFMRLSCPGRDAQTRLLVLEGGTLTAEGELGSAPTLTRKAVLELSRSRGFRSVLWAHVSAGQGVPATSIFELIGAHGQSIARTSITMGDAQTTRQTGMIAVGRLLDRLAPAEMLIPTDISEPTPWYRSPWLWTAVGVVATSAILLPLTLRDDPSEGFSVKLGGDTP